MVVFFSGHKFPQILKKSHSIVKYQAWISFDIDKLRQFIIIAPMKKEKNSFQLKDRHKHIISLILQEKMKLLAGMGCMLVFAVSTSAMAFLVKDVLDDIFITRDITRLKIIPIIVLAVFFLRGLAAYGQSFFMGYVGTHIIMKLRNQLYERITDLSISFFLKEKTGVLMSRITNDVEIVKNMVSSSVTSLLRDTFTIITLLCVVFYRDWKLACWAICILPLAFYPVVFFGRKVRGFSTGFQEQLAELNSFLHETFAGNKIVKTFCMESYEKKRFIDKNKHLFKIQLKGIIAESLSSPVMEFLGGVGIAFIIWFGGYRVINGITTAGTFVSFLTAVLLLYDPVKKIAKLNNKIQRGLAATDRIFDIIEKEDEIVEKKPAQDVSSGEHSVTFQDVSFSYTGDRCDNVLTRVNLSAHSGSVTALVGMSGGGKTTLVNLIPRFFDVTEGTIYIDDTDIRNVTVSSLRSQIGIVTQEPILFNDSIKNNIRYGRPDASDEDVIKAAKDAFAYDFVENFSDGFNTSIGELGSRLSGGEKQRICIARALLKNAPILILDEATSALDAEAERLVQKALQHLMMGRTTFVIAHRLSTVREADRIVVLSGGNIVEEGTHDNLLARNGEYYKLYQMQFEKES